MLKERVGGEHRVVGLDEAVETWGEGEIARQLGLAAVVDGQALEEQGSEAVSRTVTQNTYY